MKNVLGVVFLCGMVAFGAGAQDSGSRAWQQRLEISVPVAVPSVEIDAVNPFSKVLHVVPELNQSTLPRKVDVGGRAVFAAYVDTEGVCLGAVPLEVPFKGLTTPIVRELSETKFEPARGGGTPRPAWVVVNIQLESRVKEATIRSQVFELPNPEIPPVPVEPTRMEPPGRLRNLPVAALSELSSVAAPRRFRFRAPAQETDVAVSLLVHVNEVGRCDRYVPLEMDSGLSRWFESFLASWRFTPAQIGDEVVDAWLIYTANVKVEMASLVSGNTTVARDRSYSPDTVVP
jgi:hypothetical protein